MTVRIVSTNWWDIGSDIDGPERLNGVSFQHDGLITFGNYQYMVFYGTASLGYGNHHVNIGRRQATPSTTEWEFLTLTDYVQQTMDGHNTISMGISGDGKIHLSFDHHVNLIVSGIGSHADFIQDVPLNYRVSRDPIALSTPSDWTQVIFDEVIHELPGSAGPWGPLTYPRFQPLEGGDLLLEFRIGR